MEELTALLDERDVERILPYLNLRGYGENLVMQDSLIITAYGAVERKDHQPILEAIAENMPKMGEMEMM